MLDGVADVVVDRVELLLEIGDVAREPSGKRLVDGLAAPVGFHADHLSMIWRPPTDEFGEVDPLQVPEEAVLVDARARRKGRSPPRRGVSVLAKRPIARAKSRIWRGLTTQSGEDPNAGQGRRNSGFEAASRLQYNKGDRQSLEADDQVVHPLALSWNTECLA